MTKPDDFADARKDESLSFPDLISAHEHGIDDLRAAVAGLTGHELRSRPVTCKWSTLEVACHVCDCEQFFADRMKRTLAMDRPLLVGADGWRYPEPAQYHRRDLAEELDLVALTRRQIELLKAQPPEAWQGTAVHSHSGLLTLRQLVLQTVRHLRHHLPYIAEKRAALGAGKP
jgi:hypothetical protein